MNKEDNVIQFPRKNDWQHICQIETDDGGLLHVEGNYAHEKYEVAIYSDRADGNIVLGATQIEALKKTLDNYEKER